MSTFSTQMTPSNFQFRDAAVLRHLRAARVHLRGLCGVGREGARHAAQGEAQATLLQQGTVKWRFSIVSIEQSVK